MSQRTLLLLVVLALLAAACGDDSATTTAAATTAGATSTSLPPSTTVETVTTTTTTTTTTTAPPETEVGWMAWAASHLGEYTSTPPPCGGCSGGENPVENWRPIIFVDAEGVVWAYETDGLVRWDPISGDYGAVAGLLDPAVFAAARAPDGTLWLATYGGATTYDGTRFAAGLTPDDGLKGETTWDLWVQSNGTIWVTTNQGYVLSAWDGTTLRHWSDAPTAEFLGPGIEAVFPEWTQFNSMAETPDGTLWFGTNGKGLFSFDGTAWQQYTEDDGLASDSVEGVACTPDGTLWLDVIGGLTRFDGAAFEIIDPEIMGSWYGEYPDGLAVGPDGALWVLGGQAVFRYLDGEWETWEVVDGMDLRDTVSLVVGEDGSVWVSDIDGLARYGEMLPVGDG